MEWLGLLQPDVMRPIDSLRRPLPLTTAPGRPAALRTHAAPQVPRTQLLPEEHGQAQGVVAEHRCGAELGRS